MIKSYHTNKESTVKRFECDPKCMLAERDECDCICGGAGHQIGLENSRDRKGRFIPLTTSAKIRQLARKGTPNAQIAKALGVDFHHVYSVVRQSRKAGLLQA